MKSLLLFLTILFLNSSLFAQKDSTALSLSSSNKFPVPENPVPVSIYPVPVKNGQITIKSGKEISSVRITNIIGQEIFKTNFNNPEKEVNISFDCASKGIYILVITLSDRTRIVKKITSEGTKIN